MASSCSSTTTLQQVWSAIVLTCQEKTNAGAYKKELEIHQRQGFIDKDTLILTIEDPKARVGSGGATLNALLVVAEHLSAQHGLTTVDSSVISKSRILILHIGRDYPFSTCGPAFTTLPAKYSSNHSSSLYPDCLVTNFDCLLFYLTNRICHGSPNGVWVCSTDMMLSIPSTAGINWSSIHQDIVMVLFESSLENAVHHGVCQLDNEGNVKNIIYRGDIHEVTACKLDNGKVPLVGSIVFFNIKAVEKLLTLHSFPPLDSCTYYGLDNGAKPIQISLFFDLLLSMATGVGEDEFVSGKQSSAYGKSTRVGVKKMSEQDKATMVAAWKTLWKHLRGMKVFGALLEGGCQYHYMQQTGHCYMTQMKKCLDFIQDDFLPYKASSRTHVSIENENTLHESAIITNSIVNGSVNVKEKAVIAHCNLQGDVTIGTGCLLSGIGPNDLTDDIKNLPDWLCLLGYNISLPHISAKTVKVFVVLGVYDNLESQASFCNNNWSSFFTRTGLTADDIWVHGMPEEKRTLFNARLFPVIHPCNNNSMSALSDCCWLAGCKSGLSNDFMKRRWHASWRLSLREIMSCVDPDSEFNWRRQLFFTIGQKHVKKALEDGTNTCFLPFLKTCAAHGFHEEILASMDDVACRSSSMGVAARTLACIADVLGAMAGEKAGLRSGPAQNLAWKQAFLLLEDKNIEQGVQAMAVERSKWMDRPDLLIRAARHYEGAEQILRRHAVMTAQQFIDIKKTDCPPMNRWVVAEAPARIDFSGGWTDTPPIAYEHGGVVTNVAIKLNGKKPLQVKTRRIPQYYIKLLILAGTSHHVPIVCKELQDMMDYSQPNAPGALVKACFCAAKLVDLSSTQSLADQLRERYGGGFEVQSMADLPYGSGLGTSSILSGVVMAAVLGAAGRTADVTSLVHAVMVVEQMLTCGGGWQDNVGGLAPGFKIARSMACLPIKVEYEEIHVPSTMVDKLNECLVFVYTGKTRLAKNLLQNVVRNWYGREPNIVKVVDDLAINAENIAKALVEGDLPYFGKCISNYRQHKKLIAPGTEPEMIRQMMEAVQPHAYGQCLAGAGGGGFLCIISKSSEEASNIKDILQMKFAEEVEFYQVSIDREGLTVTVES